MRSKSVLRLPPSVLALLIAGCQSAAPARNFTTAPRGSAPIQRLAFWHDLADRPVAGNDDAFHGLLLFLDGADPHADYAARVATLQQRGLVERGFSAPAGEPVRRGTLAFAIAHALDLKGGVTMRLVGTTPRYALKELEFRGLFPPSSPNQAMSGNELIGLISKAGDYRATRSADVSAVTAQPAGHSPGGGDDDKVVEADEADAPDASWLADVGADRLSIAHPILAYMQDAAATGPTTAAAVLDGPFKATVEAIEGDAWSKPKDDAEFEPLKVGDALNQDASIETGPASKVTLKMPQGQTLVVYQLTQMTLIELRRRGGTVKTDVGIKHGRTEYEIQGAGVQYDAKVRSPNQTLAVRSTRVLLYEQPPFAGEAVSLVGRADFVRKSTGRTVSLGGRGGKVKVRADQSSAAETALASAVVDPTFANARSASEATLVANLISRGAVLSFDPVANIPVVTGGLPPKADRDVAALAPGPLTFVLTWDQPRAGPRANIDLLVTNRVGDVLLPTGGFAGSRNGGRIPFDHRGGDNGGIEFASFLANYPADLYYVSAVAVSGSAPVQLRAFLNGRRLQISDETVPGTGDNQFAVTGTASADNSPFGLVVASPTLTGPAPTGKRDRATVPKAQRRPK